MKITHIEYLNIQTIENSYIIDEIWFNVNILQIFCQTTNNFNINVNSVC